MENQRNQYVVVSRMLHWILAAMVLTMLCIGVAMVTSVANYHLFVSIHRLLGIAILFLVVVQLVNRLVNPPPPFPPTIGPMERLVARASEYTLYALMFVQPVVGWGMLSAARSPVRPLRFAASPVYPSAQRQAVRCPAGGAYGPGLLLFPHIPCSLWCDSVSHVDP